MISLFPFSASPFSAPKFAAYMLILAVIGGLSLTPADPWGAGPVAPEQDGSGTQAAEFDLLRFGKPSDEVLERLPEIGIPWFLRRAGVTGQIDASQANQLTITLASDGKTVGRYIERVQPIDADRTRLYVAFEPDDMALVRGLAAPIDTALDPLSLLRVTLAEHIRSSMEGSGFRLSVLEHGAHRSRLDAAIGALKHEQNPELDDYSINDSDSHEAAIRRAYQDEAKRARATAPKP